MLLISKSGDKSQTRNERILLQTEHATYFYIKCINAYQNLLPANQKNATAI